MNRIKELRKEINMTQSELAKKLNVAQNTISNWENESRDVDNESLVKLSEIFDVSVDYLLGKTDIKKPLPRNMYPIEEGDFIVMPVLASVKAGYDGQAIVEYSDETIPVAKIAYIGKNIIKISKKIVFSETMQHEMQHEINKKKRVLNAPSPG